MKIQWNLSIADMLYSGYLSIVDTSLRNQLSPVMVKPLGIEPLYSRHLFREPMVSTIERFHCSFLEKSIFDLHIIIPRVHLVQILNCSDYWLTTFIIWESPKMLKKDCLKNRGLVPPIQPQTDFSRTCSFARC